ncbi:DMT family transporter [Anaeromicropila herbilytica]|uniref:Uncharacterized protein n=1 Tax=Anaeromicropila herbilytica TaxID=2785025 RepID=A0A7R7IF06_9FIRM|nr:DMT family transporter [Anaeromicropila herbilytica]BCN32586.1 hypothetical protein bsdtb5_38810 [Anaeromicropila herbilytica]
MEKFKDKMMELIEMVVYAFVLFGVAMFIAYLICVFSKERDSIPMPAITQTLIYIGGLLGVAILFISNVVFEKMSEQVRVILFVISIYILGLIYFQSSAPHGPLDGIRYFLGFSVWILWMTGMVGAIWFVYKESVSNKYNRRLEEYKKSRISEIE